MEDLYGPGGADTMPPLERARIIGNIGVLMYNEGRFGESIRRIEAALVLNPYFHELWSVLGLVRLETGRLAEARQALERAVGLAPDSPEAHRYLGRCYRLLGEPDKAILHYRRALALASDPLSRQEIRKSLDRLVKASEVES